MADDGETKDDVKVPDGEVGEKLEKMFKVDEKDTSEPLTVIVCCTSADLPDVIVLTAMGEEAAIDAKEAPRG